MPKIRITNYGTSKETFWTEVGGQVLLPLLNFRDVVINIPAGDAELTPHAFEALKRMERLCEKDISEHPEPLRRDG